MGTRIRPAVSAPSMVCVCQSIYQLVTASVQRSYQSYLPARKTTVPGLEMHGMVQAMHTPRALLCLPIYLEWPCSALLSPSHLDGREWGLEAVMAGSYPRSFGPDSCTTRTLWLSGEVWGRDLGCLFDFKKTQDRSKPCALSPLIMMNCQHQNLGMCNLPQGDLWQLLHQLLQPRRITNIASTAAVLQERLHDERHFGQYD